MSTSAVKSWCFISCCLLYSLLLRIFKFSISFFFIKLRWPKNKSLYMAKNHPSEEDICLRLKNWFCSCTVSMSRLWSWMKKAKQNGRRKTYSSRGRFLSRNREPSLSQSLWFIITLGIPHSCPTFCIRIFKTEFVLPKLSFGPSSSSRSSASCCADLNLYNSYRRLLPTNMAFINCWTWNRAQLNKFTTNLEFIDSKITCLAGPEIRDILCGCISHHRSLFPSFLGCFARPLHKTTQK